MNNLWSDKKYINYLVNTLLFLAAVNFMHYGQLFVAAICIVLFIDNRFKFKVNNMRVFIILCVFAISFCLFSYKLGIYCVFGFFLPMAYYVGSNLKTVNEENIKKVLYIIAFGMAFYIFLNFIYIFSLYKNDMFNHLWDYDVWLKKKINATTISTNMMIIISLSYYLFFYEKNKFYKTIGLLLFIFVMLFDIKLGRRTPILFMPIVFALGFLMDIFVFKNKKIDIKKIAALFATVAIIILTVYLLYVFNVGNLKYTFRYLNIVTKFREYGLDTGRIDVFLDSLELMPYHLFGGQEISTILGLEIHNLWFDIYDYAGIIPFLMIIIYTIYVVIVVFKIMKRDDISNEFKTLVTLFSFGILTEALIEPIMTGSSLLLICSIVVFTCFEKLLS